MTPVPAAPFVQFPDNANLNHAQPKKMSPLRSRTLLGPRVDDLMTTQVITSVNSSLKSVQLHYPGDTDGIPKPPEQLATPIRCPVCPLLYLGFALARPGFWSDRGSLVKYKRRSWHLNNTRWDRCGYKVHGARPWLLGGQCSFIKGKIPIPPKQQPLPEKMAAAGVEDDLPTGLVTPRGIRCPQGRL